MAIMLKHPFHLPKTYYRAIGEMVTRTAFFEYHLMDAIAAILNLADSKQKRIVLMSMSVKPKLAILKALANHWVKDGKLKNEFLFVVSHAGSLINFRHYLAHGVWGYQLNPRKLELMFVPEPKDVYLPKSMQLKSKQIEMAAKAILALDKRLWKATEALKASRAP